MWWNKTFTKESKSSKKLDNLGKIILLILFIKRSSSSCLVMGNQNHPDLLCDQPYFNFLRNFRKPKLNRIQDLDGWDLGMASKTI